MWLRCGCLIVTRAAPAGSQKNAGMVRQGRKNIARASCGAGGFRQARKTAQIFLYQALSNREQPRPAVPYSTLKYTAGSLSRPASTVRWSASLMACAEVSWVMKTRGTP